MKQGRETTQEERVQIAKECIASGKNYGGMALKYQVSYTEAFQHTRRLLYEQISRRTLDYALRELSGPHGGFCCGQDADSDGVEGKYYTLTPDELVQALGKEGADRFCQWYGVTASGNFEGKSIPNLLGIANFDREPEGTAALRERVYAYRLGWTVLHRDDKVLTAWNGLALAALARAGLVLNEPRYLDAACRTAEFLAAKLTAPGGQLLARWREAAKLQLSWLAGAARDYPAGHSFAMLAFEEELWPTAELVVTAQTIPDELWPFLMNC